MPQNHGTLFLVTEPFDQRAAVMSAASKLMQAQHGADFVFCHRLSTAAGEEFPEAFSSGGAFDKIVLPATIKQSSELCELALRWSEDDPSAGAKVFAYKQLPITAALAAGRNVVLDGHSSLIQTVRLKYRRVRILNCVAQPVDEDQGVSEGNAGGNGEEEHDCAIQGENHTHEDAASPHSVHSAANSSAYSAAGQDGEVVQGSEDGFDEVPPHLEGWVTATRSARAAAASPSLMPSRPKRGASPAPPPAEELSRFETDELIGCDPTVAAFIIALRASTSDAERSAHERRAAETAAAAAAERVVLIEALAERRLLLPEAGFVALQAAGIATADALGEATDEDLDAILDAVVSDDNGGGGGTGAFSFAAAQAAFEDAEAAAAAAVEAAGAVEAGGGDPTGSVAGVRAAEQAMSTETVGAEHTDRGCNLQTGGGGSYGGSVSYMRTARADALNRSQVTVSRSSASTAQQARSSTSASQRRGGATRNGSSKSAETASFVVRPMTAASELGSLDVDSGQTEGLALLCEGRSSISPDSEDLDLSLVADGELTPQMEAMAAMTAARFGGPIDTAMAAQLQHIGEEKRFEEKPGLRPYMAGIARAQTPSKTVLVSSFDSDTWW
eukprot:SAG11_NODE_1183_length_5593_cov_7.174190_1_plen_615_part_00